jgi:Domain of unknown function (DUF5666)
MKVPKTLLSLVLAGVVFVGLPARAFQAPAAAPSAAKEVKWQGHVTRIDTDHSMIDLHGGPAPTVAAMRVAYDSSTQWTKQGKPGQQDEVKAGSFVIILGTVDDKGVMHATRIDLRAAR